MTQLPIRPVRSVCFAAALLAVTALLVSSCARETGEAGVKPIGVGFDPGDLYPAPEARGGLVDLTMVQMRGRNLDLGVTGFFNSAGAFIDESEDPFESVLGFSYLFSPSLVSIDELQLISPKGPDANLLNEDAEPGTAGACLVQVNSRGPLGTFRTVDVGDRMVFSNKDSDPEQRTEFTMGRDPGDYPLNASSVFVYYIGTAAYSEGNSLVPGNWAFGEDVYLHFDGGVPPQGVPVASIPLASDSPDESVGKEDAEDPSVFSPAELTGVSVSNYRDHQDAIPLRYDAAGSDLPDPRSNDGVLHLEWDASEEDRGSFITVGIQLLGVPEAGELTANDDYCVNAQVLEGTQDAEWLDDYNRLKSDWCDPGYEPALDIGNDESGLDYLSATDTCHDGLDNNDDGKCDEGGCFATVEDEDGELSEVWLPRDPNCARHQYKSSACGGDNLCRPVGGSRDPSDSAGELICTALDSHGEFTLETAQIDALLSQVDLETVGGAVLVVGRTNESLITVPGVRDQVGNRDNINPVRFRATQMQYGRLSWE
ncbi:MAG: hypothetical protein CL928_14910 [Deltaproteobacteria bacterium]|nr:hypothetical protein [Deltaproteobacteria bacterium]